MKKHLVASAVGVLALGVWAKTEVSGLNFLGYSEIDSRRAYLPIAIPYDAPAIRSGVEISVADVVLTATLSEGDELYVYSHKEKAYNVYTLKMNAAKTAKEWVPDTTQVITVGGATERKSVAAESNGLATGYGLWLHRIGESTNSTVQVMGQLALSINVSVLPGKSSLLGVPTEVDLDLNGADSPFAGKAAKNDLIEVPQDDGSLVMYRFDGTAWTSATRGKALESLKAGWAFWYVRKGETALEVEWSL